MPLKHNWVVFLLVLNFRLLMQSCRFFSPVLFMEISNFSRTVHTIFIKLCTVILHPKGSTVSKSYEWNVRHIDKNSPKMAKISPKTVFFPFSQKLYIRFERNSVQSFYTILLSFVCNFVKFELLGCEKHSQS